MKFTESGKPKSSLRSTTSPTVRPKGRFELTMRNPSPAAATDVDTADRPLAGALNDLLAAAHLWLDALEPFDIEWELIWPM
jgi:hypothetical protein